jgi:hypothetical protein
MTKVCYDIRFMRKELLCAGLRSDTYEIAKKTANKIISADALPILQNIATGKCVDSLVSECQLIISHCDFMIASISLSSALNLQVLWFSATSGLKFLEYTDMIDQRRGQEFFKTHPEIYAAMGGQIDR